MMALYLLGCGSAINSQSNEATDPSVVPQKVRGLLVFGHEVRELTLCGENEPIWFIDKTDGMAKELSESLSDGLYKPIFVDALASETDALQDGFGADYASAVILSKIVHAEPANEGFGCREKYDTFIYKARGNEPGWNVTIANDVIRFASINLEKPLEFATIFPTVSGEATIYKASNGHNQLTITISHDQCTNTMTGAYNTLSAKAVLDGETYSGCAIQGDQTP